MRPHRYKDLTGKKFGRLTVLSVDKITSGRVKWNCICDCGNSTSVRAGSLSGNHTQSCGCLQREFSSSINKKPLNEASKTHIYYHYRQEAKTRNLEFNLTQEQFINIITQNCFYCNKSPSQITKRGYPCNGDLLHNGIDRVDNSKGYTLENSVACCKQCNWSKRDFTKEEFTEWVKRVYDNLNLGVMYVAENTNFVDYGRENV